MSQTPEGAVKQRIKKILSDHDAYQFWPVQMGYGAKTLDCFTCVYGTWFVIEAKRPGQTPTPFQRLTIEQIKAAKGSVLVIATEKDLEMLRRICDRLKKLYETSVIAMAKATEQRKAVDNVLSAGVDSSLHKV